MIFEYKAELDSILPRQRNRTGCKVNMILLSQLLQPISGFTFYVNWINDFFKIHMARVGIGYRLEIENGWLSMQRQTKKSSSGIRKKCQKENNGSDGSCLYKKTCG